VYFAVCIAVNVAVRVAVRVAVCVAVCLRLLGVRVRMCACVNCRSLLQNIVSFIGLFVPRSMVSVGVWGGYK